MFRKLIMFFLIILVLVSCTTKDRILYICNWTDYIAEDLINQFQKEYNCRIVYKTYNSNEDMLTKLFNSEHSYDIAFPSGDYVTLLAQKGFLEPINKNKLSNYNNLDSSTLIRAESFDPGNKYAIPYFWGTTGLVYNKKYVPASILELDSWDIIGNPYFNDKNKVAMLDDPREVVGVALITAGYSPNDTSPVALKFAEDILSTWRNNVSQFDNESYKFEILDGTTWLAQSYSGDALQIMQNNPDIDFMLPVEGTSLWMDSIVIPKDAKSKELAYKFIDFLLDANNGKINAEYVQYATPNKTSQMLLSKDLINNSVIYPSEEYLSKCSMIKSIGEDVSKIEDVWNKLIK